MACWSLAGVPFKRMELNEVGVRLISRVHSVAIETVQAR